MIISIDPLGEQPIDPANTRVYYRVTQGQVVVAEKIVDGKHVATVKSRDYTGRLIDAFRMDVEENGSSSVSVSTCVKNDIWWHHVRKPVQEVSIAFYCNARDHAAVAGAKVQLSFHSITEWYVHHEELSRRLRRQNTVVTSLHAPCIDVCDDGFLEMLEMAKHAYGVRFVTVHPQRRDVQKVHCALQALQPVLESLDMLLCFENMEKSKRHNRGSRWFEDLEEFDRITREFPDVGLTFDTVHAHGIDAELFQRHAARIHVVHLSDRKDDEVHIPIGRGILDADSMLAILKEHFKGELVLDYKWEYLQQALQDQRRLQERFYHA